MKCEESKKLNKFIFIIILIVAITMLFCSISKADISEEIELDAELNDESSSINSYIEAINKSSEVIKQQNDNPYEDKPYSEDYLKWLNASDEEKAEYGDVIPAKEFIAIHNDNTDANSQLDSESKLDTNVESVNATASALPSYYKIPNLRVEEQKGGWCWAYASLKSLETYLQKNKNVNYNLAEYHLAYMRFKEFGGWNDKFEKEGKGNYSTYGEAAFHTAGYFWDFMKYTGVYKYNNYPIKGPVIGIDSENHSYNFNTENINNFKNKSPVIKVNKVVCFSSINKEYSGNKVTYKNGTTVLNNNDINNFRNAVKEQIKNNGAVYAIIDMDTSDLNNNTYSLYTNEDNIQKCHAVTIVGWDDGYKASNFNEEKTPKNDGAWIALNSWGEDFGNNGLFYISYDDAIVEKNMCGVVDAELANTQPTVNVKYTTNSNNTVTVTITSSSRINDVKIYENGGWKNATGWFLHSELSEYGRYYTAYTKKTTITKTFKKNTTEYIQVYDELGVPSQGYVTIKVEGIDTIGPTIHAVTGYNNNTWVNSNVKLTVNASDSSGLHNTAYSFDGGKTWQAGNSKTYSASESNIQIVVKDKLGNTTNYKEKINVKIDKTVPQIFLVTATDGSKTVSNNYSNNIGTDNITNTWFKNDVTLKIANTSDSSGIKSQWINSEQVNTKTFKTTTKGVNLIVYDNAGNKAQVTVNINIDSDAPTISSVTQTLAKDKQSVSLTVTATDSKSGIVGYSFDGGKTWQKSNTYKYEVNQTIEANKIQVKDNVGNIAKYNKKVAITGIDTTELKIVKETHTPTSDTITSKNVTVKLELNKKIQNLATNSGWTLSSDGKTLTKEFKNNTTQDGETLTITDSSTGRSITKKVVVLNIDKKAPTISSVEGINTNWVKNSATLVVNASDDKGLADTAYSFDGGKTWQKENKKTYTTTTSGIVIVVRDKAGLQTTYNNGEKIKVKISNQETTKEELAQNPEYSQTSYTKGTVTVTIKLNKPIKAVNGWSLSSDGKTLKRTFKQNYKETITVIDAQDTANSEDIQININNIVINGDINQDEKVNIADVLILKRHLIAGNNGSWKLQDKALKAGDINDDEKITITDLLLLKRLLLNSK